MCNSCKKIIKSFGFAFAGTLYAIKKGQNFRMMLVASTFVLCFAAICKLERMEWAILLLCMGMVLAGELMNTAIESSIDLFTKKVHPLAKASKDMAAAAVLVLSAVSVGVGCLIFTEARILAIVHSAQENFVSFALLAVVALIFIFGFENNKN